MSEILLLAGELKTVLAGFSKIVGRKTGLPILQQIKISHSASGDITLQATDLNVWATYQLEAQQPGDAVTFFLPFELLNKTVKALKPDALLTFRQDKPKVSRLVYEVGGSPVECQLEHIAPDEWPPEPQVNGVAVMLPDEFKAVLKEALECVSTQKYILTGACVDVRDKHAHYLVASDGSHLYAGNSFRFNLPSSVLIPWHKFIGWSGLAEDGNWLLSTGKKKDEAWIKITTSHWSYVSKQMEGEYPDWKHNIPTPNSKWTRLTLTASAVESLLKTVPLLPGGEENHSPITLEVLAGGKVLIKGRAKDQKEWTSIAVPEVKVTGQPVEVLLNREYVLRALRFGLVQLDVQDPITPVLFSAAGKTIAIMPVQGEAAEKFHAARKAKEKPTPTEPPKPQPQERRPEMPAMTPPERGNLKSVSPEASATKEALEKVETIKIQLRDLLGELTDLAGLLKSAEKEKRSTEKEVASVRQTIRSLQGVKL